MSGSQIARDPCDSKEEETTEGKEIVRTHPVRSWYMYIYDKHRSIMVGLDTHDLGVKRYAQVDAERRKLAFDVYTMLLKT